MAKDRDIQKIEYVCDNCGHRSESYDSKPVEPEGKQVRCVSCGEPTLRRNQK